MKAYVLGYLVLDVIQDCNLHCDMCLRGESTGKRITRDVVEKIFDSIKYVKTIVFSGGEVTLAYNEIKMILEVIKEKRVVVENYQIVVNGTIYNKKLFDLLREEFKIGNISISCDYYHDKSILEKYGDKLDIIMKNYSQIMKEEHFVGLYHLPPVLLNSGRAKNLDVTKEELVTIGFASMVYKDRLLVGPEISIDVDGNLVNGSNSYEITNDNCLGNIFETDLIELIKDKSIRTKFLYI